MSLRPALGLIAAALVSTSPASAQPAIAYASAGPALVSNIGNHDVAVQAGGGAEVLSGPVGFGGGVDYVYFPLAERTFNGRVTASSPPAHALMPHAQVTYHFGEPNGLQGYDGAGRVRPFVSGGFSFLTGSGEIWPLLQVSGGVDWWTSRRAGLRVDVREQWGGMLAVRAGIVVR